MVVVHIANRREPPLIRGPRVDLHDMAADQVRATAVQDAARLTVGVRLATPDREPRRTVLTAGVGIALPTGAVNVAHCEVSVHVRV